MNDEQDHETPERMLQRAESAIRLARDTHARGQHVSLIRADILQARELLTLALNELEARWAKGAAQMRAMVPTYVPYTPPLPPRAAKRARGKR